MNKKTTTRGHKTRMYEISGLILFVLSLFTALSLIPRVDNLCGPIGLQVANISKRGLGLSAFAIPIVLFVMSLKLFLRQEIGDLAYSFSGYIVLLISLSGMLSLVGKTTSISVLGPNTGGALGALIAGTVLRSLSPAGAYLALFLIILLALILATGLSIVGFSKGIGVIYLAVFNAIGGTISDYRQKRRRARQISRTDSPVEPPSAIPKPKKSILEKEKPIGSKDTFRLPPISILNTQDKKQTRTDKDKLVANSKLLEEKLGDYGVEGKVMGVCPGPVITMYEFEPGPGVKINKIMGLSDDLALALKALSIRIVAPVPGKSVVGIEIANQKRLPVVLRDVLASDVFISSQSKLTIALGREIMGKPVVTDLAKMPHLLIAGATGTGKSVAINSMICSTLMKATPDEVRLLMIDPKRIELAPYEGIPHLLHPVVMDPKKATLALRWAVQEMGRRYELLAEVGARNIDAYNEIIKKETGKSGRGRDGIQHERLPYIVVVIDELADLMMISSKDVEDSITRLAQMARAAGIHLILATQRPSVDVLTGVIKANFPTRISFQVSSKVDSRTILDTIGAERLLGSGDMLFLPPGTSKLVRIHGAYISDAEITRIADFLKKQKRPIYDESIIEATPEEISKEDIHDEKYEEAVKLVWETRQASISMIQRRLRIGYNRAARIIEHMEREGIVGPSDGIKPREVLMRRL
jgi:S-DNA-T family DNA segregation ATPase FtsK/SpoIIIE